MPSMLKSSVLQGKESRIMPLPQITLNGRAVDDLSLRFTPAGKPVASVRVAASERRKTQAGDWEDGERIFVNVSLWEADAEAAAEANIAKGDPVLVTGVIFEREYETRDGNKGKSLEIKHATIAKIPPRQKSGRESGTPPRGSQWGEPSPSAPAADPWATTAPTDQPPF